MIILKFYAFPTFRSLNFWILLLQSGNWQYCDIYYSFRKSRKFSILFHEERVFNSVFYHDRFLLYDLLPPINIYFFPSWKKNRDKGTFHEMRWNHFKIYILYLMLKYGTWNFPICAEYVIFCFIHFPCFFYLATRHE